MSLVRQPSIPPKLKDSRRWSQPSGGRFVDLLTELAERIGMCAEMTDGIRRSTFNGGIRAAQKEVEAMILRLCRPGALSPAKSNQSQLIEERC